MNTNRNINRDTWFFCNKPKTEAALRLFCFPFSGAGASIYRSWSDAMGEKIEVRAVQLPGRESRYNEVRELNISVLVKDIVKALESYQDKPFAFFGYSLGGLLAFEVCRELERKNMNPPEHLFIGAMRAPQTQPVHPPLSDLPDESFLQQMEYYYQPDDDAWKNPELRDVFLPVLKDDIKLSDNYTYKDETLLLCPIDVFAGADDRGAPVKLTKCWSAQTGSVMNHHLFKGGHFFINNALTEVQALVLKKLNQYCD